MWTVATFQPTSLFSLRPALSTASGGQTLLVPTPYAVKMALLDAAIRGWGLAQGVAWFPALRDLQVALAGPEQLVVSNTFIKIQRPRKNGPADSQGTGIVGPLGATIAFRAFVQFGGSLRLAIAPGEAVPEAPKTEQSKAVGEVGAAILPPLEALAAQISYFGKRGSFMQLIAAPAQVEVLAPEFVSLTNPTLTDFLPDGVMQMLDDCAPHLQFKHVNIYDPQPLQLGKDRLLRHVVLPYNLVRSSQRYQLYRQVKQDTR